MIFLRKSPGANKVSSRDVSAFKESWLHKLPQEIKKLHLSNIKKAIFGYVKKFLKSSKALVLKLEDILSAWVSSLKKKGDKSHEDVVFSEEPIFKKDSSERKFIRDLKGALQNDSSKKEAKKEVVDEEEVGFVIKARKVEKPLRSIRKSQVKRVQSRPVEQEEAREEVIAKVKDNTILFRAQEKKIIEEISVDPGNIDLYKALGFLYVEQGEYDDARSSFRQAVKLGCKDKIVKEQLEKLSR